MSALRTVGSVLFGAVATVIFFGALAVATIVLGVTVGDAVPGWLFLPFLSLYAVGGGFAAGVARAGSRARCAAVGAGGAGLGSLVVGLVVGLFATVFVASLIPSGAGTVDFGGLSLWYGGGTALAATLLGIVLGAVGGAIGGELRDAARRA